MGVPPTRTEVGIDAQLRADVFWYARQGSSLLHLTCIRSFVPCALSLYFRSQKFATFSN